VGEAREEREVIVLCFLTDIMLNWVALNVATMFRLDTLYQVNFLFLQRDRLVCVFIFAIAAVMAGSYKPFRIIDRFDSVYHILLAVGATAVVEMALVALLPKDIRMISRRELVLGIAFGALLLGMWRACAAGFIARFRSLHRFYFVLGSEREGKRIADEICRYPSSQINARYVTLEELPEQGGRLGGRVGDGKPVQTEAIVVMADDSRDLLADMLEACKERFQRTFLYSSLHDALLFEHKNLFAVAGIPLIEIASKQPATPYFYVKRCIDCAVSLAGLVLSLPITVPTAIAICVTSPGGIFYKQERLTKGGRPFKIYKFRSMVAGAEPKDETGHVLVEKGDPRVTRIGRFIRKYRIDEIPQLYNVLRGDMSLVGPRPAWREFYDVNRDELPLVEQRLTVRPGLTCLSHVFGSYSSDPADRLRYDLIYISSLSFLTDLKILLSTIRIVLGAKGAQ